MNWLKRYRHTRGFGVHSPFAFRFITECIGEQWPYYAYDTLRTPRQRFALRLGAYFQPDEIRALSPDVKALAKAARRGCPSPIQADSVALINLASPCPALLIAGKEYTPVPDEIYAGKAYAPTSGEIAVGKPKIIWIIENRAAVAAIQARLDALGCGISFIDRDTAIFAIFPTLPRQTFTPRLP